MRKNYRIEIFKEKSMKPILRKKILISKIIIIKNKNY